MLRGMTSRGIACADLAAASSPGFTLSCLPYAPASARPLAMPVLAITMHVAYAPARTPPPTPAAGAPGRPGATAQPPRPTRALPMASGVRESDPGLHKVIPVTSRITSLGALRTRRGAGVHALEILLPVTLSWKPAGLSTETPTRTGLRMAKGAAGGKVGVPGSVLPTMSAGTSTLPLGSLGREPTARTAMMAVVAAVCEIMLPARCEGETSATPTVGTGEGCC